MVKVTTVFTNARTQSNTPLSNSSLDDSVVRAMPLFDKTLLNVVDTVDRDTVDSSLRHSPDFFVTTGFSPGLSSG